MNRNVFEIEGLECSYPRNGDRSGKVVLRVEKLDIPRGMVTVILGMSGSGKSTLIETLGLMNRTMKKGEIHYFHRTGKITIRPSIWERPAQLATIRNRHFSFIFQQDFLMPYYTPEENMRIGRLIQGRTPETDGLRNEMVSRCRWMGIDPQVLDSQMPADLSVGQRQRISFIRATLKEYDVLFGDEPTGNLDEANAELLLDVLHESVHQKPERSAILVSHNIPLSVAKAGCIIVLSQVAGDLYEVSRDHHFARVPEGWMNGSGKVYDNTFLETRIRALVRNHEKTAGTYSF